MRRSPERARRRTCTLRGLRVPMLAGTAVAGACAKGKQPSHTDSRRRSGRVASSRGCCAEPLGRAIWADAPPYVWQVVGLADVGKGPQRRTHKRWTSAKSNPNCHARAHRPGVEQRKRPPRGRARSKQRFQAAKPKPKQQSHTPPIKGPWIMSAARLRTRISGPPSHPS